MFLLIAFLSLLVAEAIVLTLARMLHLSASVTASATDPRLQIAANALTYPIALGAAALAFPLLWGCTFFVGIAWRWDAAKRLAGRLVLAGLAMGFVLQVAERFIRMPDQIPMDKFFQSTGMVWFLAFFGTLLAPMFEEIAFRGMLLPALAIAVDFLRLPRDLETHLVWREGTGFSRPALVVSSVLTSLLFALIHAPQLGYTWPAVSLLAGVSLVLCWVRVRTWSVAASTLVHGSYNLSVFITLFLGTGGFRHLDKI